MRSQEVRVQRGDGGGHSLTPRTLSGFSQMSCSLPREQTSSNTVAVTVFCHQKVALLSPGMTQEDHGGRPRAFFLFRLEIEASLC